MRTSRSMIVLSDCHLAPSRERAFFRADEELVTFLRYLEESPADGGDLVLAGDTFDFLTPAVGEDNLEPFDPSSAPTRMSMILAAHREVVHALAETAASSRHRVWLLGGNHDPEVALPAVQKVVEDALRGPAGHPHLRWLVHGEAAAFLIGSAKVVVEHGDMFDDWNRIDHDDLRMAVSLLTRGIADHGFAPPPGSRLVIECVNVLRMDPRYSWVESLKPEREAVVPVLYAFLSETEKMKFRVKFLHEYLPYLTESVVSKWRRARLGTRGIVRGTSSQARRDRLRRWLHRENRRATRGQTVAETLEQLVPDLRQIAAEDDYFVIDAPDSSTDDIRALLDTGIDLIVHGHTHAAKGYLVGRGAYLNSGTWGELVRLPLSSAADDEWLSFLRGLASGSAPTMQRRTFVRVQVGEDGTTTAALAEWRDRAEVPLASWQFDPVAARWMGVDAHHD